MPVLSSVLLQRAVGTFGLSGLDRLLCFMIVKELQTFNQRLERQVVRSKDRSWITTLEDLSKTLAPTESVIGIWPTPAKCKAFGHLYLLCSHIEYKYECIDIMGMS